MAEEQEYTWAQIAGQIGMVMSMWKGMSAMQDMMNQAAQVEAYLANSDALVAALDSKLEEKRQALRDVAQEYVDLEQLIKSEKAEHRKKMTAATKKLSEHEKACADKMKAAEDALAKNLEDLNRVHADSLADYEAAIGEKGQKLLEVEKKLEDAQAALDELKGRL